MGGQPLTVLSPDYNDHVSKMLSWMDTSLVRAIGQRWVRKVVFCISTDDPAIDTLGNTIVERYEFIIAFPQEQDGKFYLSLRNSLVPVNPMDKDAAEAAFASMNDALNQQMLQMKSLPEQRWLSLRVVYDPDTVPADFQGHSEQFAVRPMTATEMRNFGTVVPSKTVPVGRLETEHHACKVQVVAALDIFAEDSLPGFNGFSQATINPQDSVSQYPWHGRVVDLADDRGALLPQQLALQRVLTGCATDDDNTFARSFCTIFLVAHGTPKKSWTRNALQKLSQLQIKVCDRELVQLESQGFLRPADFNANVRVAAPMAEFPWVAGALQSFISAWATVGFPADLLVSERDAFVQSYVDAAADAQIASTGDVVHESVMSTPSKRPRDAGGHLADSPKRVSA